MSVGEGRLKGDSEMRGHTAEAKPSAPCCVESGVGQNMITTMMEMQRCRRGMREQFLRDKRLGNIFKVNGHWS